MGNGIGPQLTQARGLTMTITNSQLSSRAYTHAVVHLGAPYGDYEGGHVVSLHKSEGGAKNALWRMGELNARQRCVIALDDQNAGNRWVFADYATPRQYFMAG